MRDYEKTFAAERAKFAGIQSFSIQFDSIFFFLFKKHSFAKNRCRKRNQEANWRRKRAKTMQVQRKTTKKKYLDFLFWHIYWSSCDTDKRWSRSSLHFSHFHIWSLFLLDADTDDKAKRPTKAASKHREINSRYSK